MESSKNAMYTYRGNMVNIYTNKTSCTLIKTRTLILHNESCKQM